MGFPGRTPLVNAFINQSLDLWEEAKQSKDYQAADEIRAALRAVNVEPDLERDPNRGGGGGGRRDEPRGGGGGGGGRRGGRDNVEDLLDRWVSAKRDRDFQTADDIRAQLRDLGVEPE